MYVPITRLTHAYTDKRIFKPELQFTRVSPIHLTYRKEDGHTWRPKYDLQKRGLQTWRPLLLW